MIEVIDRGILHGEIYCAKGCGRGCTLAEYKETVRAAEYFAERLGDGWDVEIWDNLGWHYKAISKTGVLKIFKSKRGYAVYLGEGRNGGGEFVSHHPSDPHLSIEDAIKSLDERIDHYQSLREKAIKSLE